MTLSTVTTLYKSSLYIDQFYTRISKETQKIYEIIFVADRAGYDKRYAIELKVGYGSINLHCKRSITF